MALLKIGDIVLATGGGGGGTGTALYNSSITATATASATATYTMVQKPLSAYDDTAVLPTATGSASSNPYGPIELYRWGDVSGLSSVAWSSNMNSNFTAVLFTGSSGPGWENSAALQLYQPVGTANTNWTASTIHTAGLDAESTVGFGLVRYWGMTDSDTMSSEMHGGVVTGTSLPYPDRPETEDVTASASSVSEQYISSNGYVVDSTLAVSPELTTTSNAFALSTSQPGSLVPRTYTCMTGLLKKANFPAGYPDTAYSASNFVSGATATGVTGLF